MVIADKYLIQNDQDIDFIKDALSKKKLSGTSDIIDEYEQSLASFWGTKYAVAVSSGTAAICTSLNILNINKGDEVIVSVLAPIMSALPIIQMGAIPIFADCQINSFDFDYIKLESYITKKTRAIMAVPIYGYPFDYDKLNDICKTHKLLFIEDAAQTHGASYKDKKLGCFGLMSCFSTHDKKILATGEGGFVLTDSLELRNKAKAYIQFDNMSGLNFGTNFKLSTLQAAIGIIRINQINNQLIMIKKMLICFSKF